MTIDILPDDSLLDIFDSFSGPYDVYSRPWNWRRLAQVCRRLRQIILASPHRLHVQHLCTLGTPVRKLLSFLPDLPIVIDYYDYSDASLTCLSPNDEDDVIAALEHSNRVSALNLVVTTTQLVKLVTVMQAQESYPALKYLRFTLDADSPVLPDGFFGVSAPNLQVLRLYGVPFPTLPTILSSASDLVELDLFDIPESGYISPEAMAAALAALSSLQSFSIEFTSNNSCPYRIGLPSVTRTVLPTLVSFDFRGVSDYLEDLMARIDCPKLKLTRIRYLHRHVGFRVTHLFEFINRLEDPRFDRIDILFGNVSDNSIQVYHSRNVITISISFHGEEWGVSHIFQVFGQFSANLSEVHHLSICNNRGLEIGDNELVQFLYPFTPVQTLHASGDWVDHNPLSPEAVTGEMVTKVLSALGSLHFDSPRAAFFENYIIVRKLSGCNRHQDSLARTMEF